MKIWIFAALLCSVVVGRLASDEGDLESKFAPARAAAELFLDALGENGSSAKDGDIFSTLMSDEFRKAKLPTTILTSSSEPILRYFRAHRVFFVAFGDGRKPDSLQRRIVRLRVHIPSSADQPAKAQVQGLLLIDRVDIEPGSSSARGLTLMREIFLPMEFRPDGQVRIDPTAISVNGLVFDPSVEMVPGNLFDRLNLIGRGN